MKEADHVLSRRLLRKGSSAYEAYYRKHPEFKEADDRAREAPGLLSPDSKYYHRPSFEAAAVNFDLLEHLAPMSGIDNEDKAAPTGPAANPSMADPSRTATFLKSWLLKTGAHQVGFTALRPEHLYSHKGRGARVGQEIPFRKETALVLTVEMDLEMMLPAPQGTTVMESSEQYLRSGILALKAASWIRKMGYRAKVHMDGHYELVCPLVAADAGLGVIGRMGLLITPRLGPRVRIAVVTTDMPLEHSAALSDRSVLDFCLHCRKCARVCPSAAIPFEGPFGEKGSERWQISSEKCYQFWCTSGTDCGRCVITCPYSHRDNAFHRLVRFGIKNNLLFRRLAIKLDDLFYGKKPRPATLPDWTNIERLT